MNPAITFLYDGDCTLCAREVAMLRRLDRGRGRLAFDDIAAPGFDTARYGATHAELMERNRPRLSGRGEVCNADRCTLHAAGTRDPARPDAAGAQPR